MVFRRLADGDIHSLQVYYDELSPHDKAWFKPHSFKREIIQAIVDGTGDKFEPYIAIDGGHRIVAYFFASRGITENDQRRIEESGMNIANKIIWSIAPSVAYEFRGTGLSNKLFEKIEEQLAEACCDFLVLQGGVNSTNVRAISYYRKIGFILAGEFKRGDESNYAMYKVLGLTSYARTSDKFEF